MEKRKALIQTGDWKRLSGAVGSVLGTKGWPATSWGKECCKCKKHPVPGPGEQQEQGCLAPRAGVEPRYMGQGVREQA